MNKLPLAQLPKILPGLESLLGNIPVLSSVGKAATPSAVSVPSAVPTASAVPSAVAGNGATGKLLTDAAGPVKNLLTVLGQDLKVLLIELSPEVAALVSGLGLPSVGIPLGSVVASASEVGQLVSDIAPGVEGLLTVVSNDGSALLIQLAPSVAALISGLGLPAVGVPVGTVIATIGQHL